MIISNHNITMNPKEIARKLREVVSNVSDSLIHTAPRSVSLVHYTFRNDGLESFHKAERTGAGTSLVSSLVRNLLEISVSMEDWQHYVKDSVQIGSHDKYLSRFVLSYGMSVKENYTSISNNSIN